MKKKNGAKKDGAKSPRASESRRKFIQQGATALLATQSYVVVSVLGSKKAQAGQKGMDTCLSCTSGATVVHPDKPCCQSCTGCTTGCTGCTKVCTSGCCISCTTSTK